MLPAFMRSYQPDAIAVKDDKKIAIEIKRDATRRAARMAELQQIFSKHPEWEFGSTIFRVVPRRRTFKTPDLSEIDAALAEVDQLKRAGHLRAALIMAWAALEARVGPQDVARPQPANKVNEVLASEGVVTPAEADSLRKAMALRNAATHGHLAAPITEQGVEQVVAMVSLIIDLAKGSASP